MKAPGLPPQKEADDGAALPNFLAAGYFCVKKFYIEYEFYHAYEAMLLARGL